MGKFTLHNRVLCEVRRRVHLYTLFRWLKRTSSSCITEICRHLGLGFRFGGPKGFISGLDQLKQGHIQGRLLSAGQTLPALPNVSLIRMAGMNQNGRQPWPVFWIKQKNARLVGPSLAPIDSTKRVLLDAVYGKEFCYSDPSFNYRILPKPIFLKGAWTSIIGRWSSGFYHWFTDDLCRLELLPEFPIHTKILVRGPLEPFQRESLAMLGLLDRVRETSEHHLLLKEYYFSSSVCMTGCANPRSTLWLRSQFLPHASARPTPKKFFILRSGKTRGIINQEEIKSFLHSKGWAIVDLEKLSLAEQIAYFQNADAILGDHGAGFTNLIWSKPSVKVLELCSDNFLNGCYESIALSVGAHYLFKVFKANYANRISVPLSEIRNFVGLCDSQK